MNKECMITGKTLNVYNDKEILHKRELEHSIDIGQILALENRMEFLCRRDDEVCFFFIFSLSQKTVSKDSYRSLRNNQRSLFIYFTSF